jgi:hypothetical protein
MSPTLRQLQTNRAKPVTRKTLAKIAIEQAGLNPSQMSEWAYINVISLLNLEKNAITNRVRTLVDLIHKSGELTERMRLAPPSEARRLCEERNEALEDLNRRLAKFRWHPVVLLGLAPNFRVTYEAVTTTDGAYFENRAVRWLIQYMGAVNRIRRCRHCSIWFFAVIDHQKFCSDKCRKSSAAQGQEFKEKRALYMKKYRIDQAAQEERSKRLVKGK